MSLETDVAGVLRKDPAGRISYSLDHITVDKVQMEFVAKAIESGDVAVRVTSVGNLLGAAYSSFKGRRQEAGQKKLIGEIAIPRAGLLNDPIGKAGIFHESVHALLDVRPSSISVRNGDEALAYMADALYLQAKNTPISSTPENMAIYNAAFAIIAKHKMLSKRGVALKWSDCVDLLGAINNNSAYR